VRCCAKQHECVVTVLLHRSCTLLWLSRTQPAQISKIAHFTTLVVTSSTLFKSVILVRLGRIPQVASSLISLQDGVLVQKRAPPLKNCPSPTNLFTGRNDVLLQLHKCFTPLPTSVESAQQRRFVLYGLGGGGKTQIAFKFIRECQMETQLHRCA
jgi:hypothetical protein